MIGRDYILIDLQFLPVKFIAKKVVVLMNEQVVANIQCAVLLKTVGMTIVSLHLIR